MVLRGVQLASVKYGSVWSRSVRMPAAVAANHPLSRTSEPRTASQHQEGHEASTQSGKLLWQASGRFAVLELVVTRHSSAKPARGRQPPNIN